MLTIKYRSDFAYIQDRTTNSYWYPNVQFTPQDIPGDSTILVPAQSGLTGGVITFTKFINRLDLRKNYTLIMPIINGNVMNGKSVQFMANEIYKDGELIKSGQGRDIKDFDGFTKTAKGYKSNCEHKICFGKSYFVGENPSLFIEKGFEFDISAPKIVRWAIDNQPTRVAACIHDKLIEENYTHKFRDQAFYDVLRHCGAGFLYANVLWFSVRAFSILTEKRWV